MVFSRCLRREDVARQTGVYDKEGKLVAADATTGDIAQNKEGDAYALDLNGNLDVNKIYDAAAKYDPRDIYNALINSSKYGGWDNIENGIGDGGTITIRTRCNHEDG